MLQLVTYDKFISIRFPDVNLIKMRNETCPLACSLLVCLFVCFSIGSKQEG